MSLRFAIELETLILQRDPARIRALLARMMEDPAANDAWIERAHAFLSTTRIEVVFLHPDAKVAYNEHTTNAETLEAVKEYLRCVRAGGKILTPTSHGGRESDTVLLRGEQHQAYISLFRLSNTEISALEATGRQSFQLRYSSGNGIGYVTNSTGEDVLGFYEHHPAGTMVDIRIHPVYRQPGAAWYFRRSSEAFVETTDNFSRSAEALMPPSYVAKLKTRPLPWSVVYMQAYKLPLFIRRYASGSAQLPLLPVHVRGGETWNDATAAFIRTRPCDTKAALELFGNVISCRGTDEAVTGFLLRGLPGSGKSTVAVQTALAMGINPLEVEIGKLRGGSYRGDAGAAFRALFTRSYGECGLAVSVVDEFDLIANSKDENCKEQVTELLNGFTAQNKPKHLTLFASTNNDKSIVGAILSRFSSVLVVAAPRLSELARLLHDPNHPFRRGVDASMRENVPVASMGLTARDIVDVPDVAEANVDVLLCVARQAKKGNLFCIGRGIGIAPFEIARAAPDRSSGSIVLQHFLIGASKLGLLTGRIMLLHSDLESVWVDVELEPLKEDLVIAGEAVPGTASSSPQPHQDHVVRAGSWTRCYGPMPLRDVYLALQCLAVECDATHFNYITQEFLDHATGVTTNESSVDDRRAIGLKLIADFCIHNVQSSVIVVPASFFFVDANALGDGAQNRGVSEVFRSSMFVRFGCSGTGRVGADPRKQKFVVAHCATVSELKHITDSCFFRSSSLIELKVLGSRDPFPCARCNKPNIVNTAATGCLHAPRTTFDDVDSAAGVPAEELAMMRQQPGIVWCEVTTEVPKPPYTVYFKGHDAISSFSFEGIEKVTFGSRCGCVATDIPGLIEASKHTDHTHASMTVFKRDREERVTIMPLADVSSRSRVKSIKVLCDVCDGSPGAEGRESCQVRRHVKPSLQEYAIPDDELHMQACPQCTVQLAAGRCYCSFCARLVPKTVSPTKGYSVQPIDTTPAVRLVVQLRHEHPGRTPDLVSVFGLDDLRRNLLSAYGASAIPSEDARPRQHVRDPATKVCALCLLSTDPAFLNMSNDVWALHMQRVPCGPGLIINDERYGVRRPTADVLEAGLFCLVRREDGDIQSGLVWVLRRGMREQRSTSHAHKTQLGEFSGLVEGTSESRLARGVQISRCPPASQQRGATVVAATTLLTWVPSVEAATCLW